MTRVQDVMKREGVDNLSNRIKTNKFSIFVLSPYQTRLASHICFPVLCGCEEEPS